MLNIPGHGSGQVRILARRHDTFGNDEENLQDGYGGFYVPNTLNDPLDTGLYELYYEQGFFDNQLSLTVGKVHPQTYIDTNPLGIDENEQWLNVAFIAPVGVVPLLGVYSPGAAFEWHPGGEDARFYLHGCVVDSLGSSADSFEQTDEGKLSAYLELGLLPRFDDPLGLGKTRGTLRFYGFHVNGDTDTRFGGDGDFTARSGAGFGFSTDLTFGDGGWGVLARYAINEQNLTDFHEFASLGLLSLRPFGREADLAGIAAAWAEPARVSNLREETVIEAFYRLQVTETLQLTPDVQYIQRPAFDRDVSDTFVVGLRVRSQF